MAHLLHPSNLRHINDINNNNNNKIPLRKGLHNNASDYRTNGLYRTLTANPNRKKLTPYPYSPFVR